MARRVWVFSLYHRGNSLNRRLQGFPQQIKMLLTFRDVLVYALIVEDPSSGVTDRPHGHGNPENAPILPVKLGFVVFDKTIFLNYLNYLRSFFRIYIYLTGRIGHGSRQFIRRFIAEYPCHGGVGHEYLSFRRRTEDAFLGILKYAPVSLFRQFAVGNVLSQHGYSGYPAVMNHGIE